MTTETKYVVRGYSTARDEWCDIHSYDLEEDAINSLNLSKQTLMIHYPYVHDMHVAVRTITTNYERVK